MIRSYPCPPALHSSRSHVVFLLFLLFLFSFTNQEDLLERVESAFTLFRQHGGKARRQRKRARDKTADNDEDAIVAALAKTGGGGGHGGMDMDTEEDRRGDGNGLPPPVRAKVSINIFEDVDDRWVRCRCRGRLVSLYFVLPPRRGGALACCVPFRRETVGHASSRGRSMIVSTGPLFHGQSFFYLFLSKVAQNGFPNPTYICRRGVGGGGAV